jgi:hypothetical protein
LLKKKRPTGKENSIKHETKQHKEQLQAGKTTTKNRHTQETKGTNEHDKKELKKGTAISLKTSINTRRWPNWAETCCVILKFKI